MNGSRTLVVYYSRTGTTRRVAEVLARLFHADLEEIVDRQNRMGLLGFIRSGNEGFFGRKVDIGEPEYDPANYDLVLVGTPIWRMSVSSPVRTYLDLMSAKLPGVAFFLTYGGFGGSGRVFGQMEKLSGKAPLARLALKERQVIRGGVAELERFFEQLAARELLHPTRPPVERPAPH